MTRKIEIDEAQLNKEFEDVLDEMYYQYHFHPTNIPHFDNLEDTNAWMHNMANSLKNTGSDDWCNGLPRGNRRVSHGRIR